MFRLSRFSFVVVVRFRSCHGRVDFVCRPRNNHICERSTTYNETASNVCRGFVLFVAVRAMIFHAADRQISIVLARAPSSFHHPPHPPPPPSPFLPLIPLLLLLPLLHSSLSSSSSSYYNNENKSFQRKKKKKKKMKRKKKEEER